MESLGVKYTQENRCCNGNWQEMGGWKKLHTLLHPQKLDLFIYLWFCPSSSTDVLKRTNLDWRLTSRVYTIYFHRTILCGIWTFCCSWFVWYFFIFGLVMWCFFPPSSWHVDSLRDRHFSLSFLWRWSFI